MMEWKSLISTNNLKLAWRRINTGRNLQYKRFFRNAYLVYEGASNEYIKKLHEELKNKEWKAHHATRLYIPKPSGLQRPLSLLDIEDQIVLQAIANKYAQESYKQRRSVEKNTVFSNILTTPHNSIFFTENWQTTYGAFQQECQKYFNQGFNWSAQFDLAAYYDTISHDLLMKIVSSRGGGTQQDDRIKKWFGKWSAENSESETGHGIPQGPIASNFLSEVFFLPIDIKMQKQQEFKYIRYVDDIRLFARNENDVRKAVIQLEQECRHRGLIPQGSKFDIRRLKSAGEAMGSLPSIPPTQERSLIEPSMTTQQALDILKDKKVIGGKTNRIKDKSRFRYAMYRAPENREILDIVLRLLPRHPEHIDAFVAYLQHYGRRPRIAKKALNYLNSGVPYSYVRGELWHVIARCASEKEMRSAFQIACEDSKIKSRRKCVALSWGVMNFLIQYERNHSVSNKRRLLHENPISRSLLAPIFKNAEFSKKGLGSKLLKGTLMEQFAGARELQRRNITLHSLGLRQKNLPYTCRVALKSLGVIHRKARQDTPDRVNEYLKSLYGCNHTLIWRKFLGAEYEHALQILREAKSYFEAHRSVWLSSQDSFNEILIRQFFYFLEQNNLDGYSKLIDRQGNLVTYGKLIQKQGRFGEIYPSIVDKLSHIHKRRNKLPGTHPYDSKNEKNKWLTKPESKEMASYAKSAINSIIAIVEKINNQRKKEKSSRYSI